MSTRIILWVCFSPAKHKEQPGNILRTETALRAHDVRLYQKKRKMKKPNECESINDIRTAIDEIDKDIISLIAKRASYVKAAAQFKNNQTDVKAPDRVKAMLQKRAEWAEKENLNPKIITKIYTELVNFFINEEMTKWKQEKKGAE